MENEIWNKNLECIHQDSNSGQAGSQGAQTKQITNMQKCGIKPRQWRFQALHKINQQKQHQEDSNSGSLGSNERLK